MLKPTVARKSSTATRGQWHTLLENLTPVTEREMTDAEKTERERLVKGMKKAKGDFEKRYPGRGKEVMYATATKRAMGEEGMTQVPLSAGARVNVRHKGKTVPGKVVRFDKGDAHGSPFYVVDVGEYASIKVPAHKVMQEVMDASPNSGGRTPSSAKNASYPYSWECMQCNHTWRSNESGQTSPVRCPKCGASGEDDILPGPADQVMQEAPASATVSCADCGQPLTAAEKKKASRTCDACDLAQRNDFDRRRGMDEAPDHEEHPMHVDLQFDGDDVSATDDQDMMLAQLDAIASRASKLHQTLGQVAIHEVPAWIQDKVSIADHNLNAILDYYMYETATLTEAEKGATKGEIAWFLQPAHVVAKMLNGADYVPVGVKAEDIVNNAVIEFLKSSHTTETWKAAGSALSAVHDVAGVNWDMSLVKPALQQAMGIQAKKAKPEPEPEAEPAPKEAPKAKEKEAPKTVAPKPQEKAQPAPEAASEKAPEKKEKAAEPKATTEAVEIEIKLGKPMDKVTFQQKRQAALDFAAATCPGMNPNGVTPEQIVNNAVSVWFHRHPVPLDAELEVLGNALDLLSTLGIDWDFHLVPAMYLQTLKLPNVKVTEVDEKDTSAAGKKVEKLDDILIKL